VLQPIAAFVYYNPRQQQAVSRQQAEVGNFHAPQVPAQLSSAHWRGFAKIIL